MYTEKIVKLARQNGYVETLSGRRRYFVGIKSEHPSVRSQAERQAINTTVQGSAADIAKCAILKMEKILKTINHRHSVDFVLHIHDELIYEGPINLAKQIAILLKSSMEKCVTLSVPLRAKVKIGHSWGSLNALL